MKNLFAIPMLLLALAGAQQSAAAAAKPTSGAAGDEMARDAEAETAESPFRFGLFRLFAQKPDTQPGDDPGVVKPERSVAPLRIDGARRHPAKLWLQSGRNSEALESQLGPEHFDDPQVLRPRPGTESLVGFRWRL